MRLAPGTPLHVGLMFDEAQPVTPIGRLALADGLAQFEWSAAAVERRWRIDPLLYPAEPGG